MDWEDKFSSIVRETERNLAKAKGKLSSKALNPLSSSYQDTLQSNAKCTHISNSAIGSSSLKGKTSLNYFDVGKADTSFGNMSASSFQVLHMQEQIDSQNRTIEKLKHLVKSLDGERDYYKEQITQLKGEVDLLTSTMRNQSSLITSDLTMSNVKRDVMREVEKVKSMVQSFEKDSARRTPAPSPRFDPEFWNIKENLTHSLDHVRFELNQMKGRIDRMEGQLAIDNLARMKQDTNTDPFHKSFYDATEYLRSKPLFTPTSKVVPTVTETDLHHLRTAISSINSKLDNIERKSHRESTVFDDGNMRPTRYSPRINPYHSPPSFSEPSHHLFMSSDLHSLSDPSDLSNFSEYNDDSDDDIDLLGLNLEDDRPILKNSTSSRLKETYGKKGRVEFDLSDLDLSDVEEGEGEDFDLESLDLDH